MTEDTKPVQSEERPSIEFVVENIPRETLELMMGWISQDQVEEIRPHEKHTDVYWFTGEPPFRVRHWACSSSPNLPPPGASDE